MKIAKDAIKVWLPESIQHTTYSCGAAALHSVLAYWGLGANCDLDYIDALESDSKLGTLPENIINYAQGKGLKTKEICGIDDLKHQLLLKIPVICLIQAWNKKQSYKKNRSGHYSTAIGYDSTKIYFQDSLIAGKRAYLTNKQFLHRWHDQDHFGNLYHQYGIAIWHKEPKYLTQAVKIF